MDNGTVTATLTTIMLVFDKAFFTKYSLATLKASKYINDYNQKYNAITEALKAVRNLQDGTFLHSISAPYSDKGCVYLMYEKEADPLVESSVANTNVSYKKIYSESTVPMENLCDLITKYRLLEKSEPGDTIQRTNGVYYKCSEQFALRVYYRNTADYPNHAAIYTEGRNMKRVTRAEGKPYPFSFSSSGVMVYSKDIPQKRYVWKKREEQDRTKANVMLFGKESDYEETHSVFRYINDTVRLLNGTKGVTVKPVMWKGVKHTQRIGEDTESYYHMNKEAAKAIMEGGITIQAGEGVFPSIVRKMEDALRVFFAKTYIGSVKRTGGSGVKYSRICIKSSGVIAIKAAKKVISPVAQQDGWTIFDAGCKKVAGITVYTYGVNESMIEGTLYDEDGNRVEKIRLRCNDNEFAAGKLPVKENGKFIIKIIKSTNEDVPYKKDLRTQHITEDTIIDQYDNPIALCRNIIYQLIIKSDLSRKKFTFLEIPEFADYEFIYSFKDVFATMKVLDGKSFFIAETSVTDRMTFCSMTEIQKKEQYAIMTPSGQMFIIEDAGYSLMPDMSFSAKYATRSKVAENEPLAPFLDYVQYDINGNQYYTAGWDLVDSNRKSYTYMPQIRRFKTRGNEKIDMTMFFRLLNVPFVWMAQKNTVIPFPFKYLREYVEVNQY